MGDAFDAGYILGLLNGEDPCGCLRWGIASGASCVRFIVAATESVFNRPEAEAFMREHPLRIDTPCEWEGLGKFSVFSLIFSLNTEN